jgi:hypothetical protein
MEKGVLDNDDDDDIVHSWYYNTLSILKIWRVTVIDQWMWRPNRTREAQRKFSLVFRCIGHQSR